ncbi:MAG: response regulator transcription factor [Thermodesulfobacteriota bacterium]|jgi:DNA-binding NarL/FixJ family response regulator|nr:response regulator transcription factor [Candidatus Dadabacteria bacterium]
MLKVLIADDHPVVRQGVKQILAEELQLKQFGEARNAREVLENVSKKKWDILILDINLPDMNGLEILRQLKKVHPDLPVLVLTVFDEDQIAIRVLKAGASGFVTKETMPNELISAVKKIHSGGKYVSPSLAEKLVFNIYAEDEKPVHHKLSNREYQVICLIAAGKSVKQIAEELYLSIQTIRTYRTRILEKMEMNTDAELIHYAIQHGLIHPPNI